MDPKEQLVRDFYAARARRDWRAVRGMLADDVVWQEAGDEDFSGTHRGAGDVTALLEKLVEITGGTFSLEPVKFVVTAEHVATNARWHAERGVKRAEGNDFAVFRVTEGKIPAPGSSPTASIQQR